MCVMPTPPRTDMARSTSHYKTPRNGEPYNVRALSPIPPDRKCGGSGKAELCLNSNTVQLSRFHRIFVKSIRNFWNDAQQWNKTLNDNGVHPTDLVDMLVNSSLQNPQGKVKSYNYWNQYGKVCIMQVRNKSRVLVKQENLFEGNNVHYAWSMVSVTFPKKI